jgi:hypothetical protein
LASVARRRFDKPMGGTSCRLLWWRGHGDNAPFVPSYKGLDAKNHATLTYHVSKKTLSKQYGHADKLDDL